MQLDSGRPDRATRGEIVPLASVREGVAGQVVLDCLLAAYLAMRQGVLE